MNEDNILREFRHWLGEHRRWSFVDPWSPDDSPIVLFFWDQLRIQLVVKNGNLMIGEVPIPLPEWVARLHTRLRDHWPSSTASGEDLLRVLDRVLADMDACTPDPDPSPVELGEGD